MPKSDAFLTKYSSATALSSFQKRYIAVTVDSRCGNEAILVCHSATRTQNDTLV